MTDIPSNVQQLNTGHPCESGLFDQSFVCDQTDTHRAHVGGCVVWLCDAHRGVIAIKPTAES